MTRPRRKNLPRYRRVLHVTLIAIAIVVGLPGGLIAWRRATGNFGVVIVGRVYRSAQLDTGQLETVIRERGIKTVLNLRGPNPDEDWYRRELSTTLRLGATQVDVPLASDKWMSREQALALVERLERCEYPVLIHCEFGAERTGLVAALVELLEPSGSLADARDQFSLNYLFIAGKDGRVMRGHLERYERWLRKTGRAHEPATFRRWLAREYWPESPNREDWPCNPYPLFVVTSPGGRVEVKLPSNPCPPGLRASVHKRAP